MHSRIISLFFLIAVSIQASASEKLVEDRVVASEAVPVSFIKTEVGGFIEPQMRNISNDEANSGYRLGDAALYLKHQNGNAKLFVDLPFVGAQVSNDILFAQDKAQAFISYTKENWEVVFGQFDTIFGFELNDSSQRYFSEPGLAFRKSLPVTHTGLNVNSTWGPVTLKLLQANPDNQGVRNGSEYENGAQVVAALGDYSAAMGYLSRKLGDDEKKFAEILLGANWGSVSLNLQANQVEEIANPDKATALMAHLVYKMSALWSAGVRYDKADKFLGFYSGAETTLGTTYHLTENLDAHAEMHWEKAKLLETDNFSEHRNFILSALYRF